MLFLFTLMLHQKLYIYVVVYRYIWMEQKWHVRGLGFSGYSDLLQAQVAGKIGD